jgi:hypothetical protein
VKKIVTENGTVRYGTLRYGTVGYATVRYATVRYAMARYGTLRYATVRYGTLWYATVRYGTLRFVTVRDVTVRYGTVLWINSDSLLYCKHFFGSIDYKPFIFKNNEKYYRNPLNNDAAPKVRFSLKRQRFRPYFTAIN